VIKEHVRCWIKSVVDNPIKQPNFIAANIDFYPPVHMQVFSKYSRLLHNTFSPQNATIPLPRLSIPR
jgi:hypothetical protein